MEIIYGTSKIATLFIGQQRNRTGEGGVDAGNSFTMNAPLRVMNASTVDSATAWTSCRRC